MRILVTNPVKQYTHRLCEVLQQAGYLDTYLTTIWHKPHSVIYRNVIARLPKSLKARADHILKKRYHPGLDESHIRTNPMGELLRQFGVQLFSLSSEKWIYYVERAHDRHVAKQLKEGNIRPDMIISYEKSAEATFRQAKKLGITTVLDLAQVHYQFIADLRTPFPVFNDVLGNEKLLAQINETKEAEYQLADYILTLSEFSRKTLIDKGIPAEKVFKVSLGFDPSQFSPKPTPQPAAPFRLLFPCTETKRKGIQVLLEAFRRLKLPNTELYVVGPVADAKELLDQYKGEFTYVPFLHHEELVRYYQMADVFVFPSLLDSWAMVVLEAMACGTPAIVTENTGSQDAVKEGGGFVIPPGDIEALMEKIKYLYENRDEVERLGAEAIDVAANYTWNHYATNLIHALNEMQNQSQAVC